MFRFEPRPTRQRGAALILVLVMLMALTMIAVVAMRTTTVDLKAATNNMLSKLAFQDSETVRTMMNDILADHTFSRVWPSDLLGTTPVPGEPEIPPGMTVLDLTELLWSEVPDDYDTPTDPAARDLTYRVDEDGDGDFTGPGDFDADIYSFNIGRAPAVGADTSQAKGYEGFGGGAAGGGANVFYDLRVQARAAGNARALTGAILRAPIRN